MEPIGAAASAAVVAAGKAAGEAAPGVFARLFGPSADVLGDHWATLLKQRLGNVQRVVEAADQMTSSEPGSIPPRVAARIFEDAQWADEPMMAEYLSGVLASSRTPGGTDDRGVYWSSLAARLSSDQLRLHYMIYREASEALFELDLTKVSFPYFHVFIPLDVMEDDRGWPESSAWNYFEDAVWGLVNEGLLSIDKTQTGQVASLAQQWDIDASEHNAGAVVTTSVMGFKLYRWGTGNGRTGLASKHPTQDQHFEGLPARHPALRLVDRRGFQAL